MLQRGASPGARRGDIGATFFVDARLASWANLSGNVGYTFVSNPKFGAFTLLDRPNEFTWAVGVDLPVNKYFQPMFEFSSKKYVGSRTPNSLEQDPMDGVAGARIFFRRWVGISLAYRYNFNQQDAASFSGASNSTTVLIPCPTGTPNCVAQSIVRTTSDVPFGFTPSTDPHGYIAQFFIGRRDKRDGDVENKAANVNSVNLSDSVISLPCRPGFRSKSGGCNDSKTISVQTSASDPENDPLVYNYTVSGGRIVGTGANVQWDLSNAQPGTYTITTGVDDGCGVCGKTDTRTVKVEECNDCVQVCECASLSVSDGGVVAPGAAMNFTANYGGTGVTYNWSVSAGTISSGQGTSSISVDTTGLAGQNVTATVQIGGVDASCNCPTEANGSGSVSAKPEKTLVDTFGKQVDDEVKARVDAFYITLNNNPNAQGYIINYGTAAEIKKRRAQIMKAINFRKYDAGRVTFVDSPGAAGINTKFYLVPAGAEASNW
ncbi:MAG: hypothetical protein ABL952_02405 [Pyrinomonadaceae bacterium]